MPSTKQRKILNRSCGEKNAQRKVRFKIYDHSDPNTPVASDISVIDDEADKMETLTPKPKEGKNELLNASLSLSPVKSALANFTTAERESHFNFCMKLSLQNKITAKNAFSLHLIDVFSDNVKQGGDPNFQMASLTLDASARIYGFRVDCLHAETLKMSTSLHSERMRKDDEDGNGENKIDAADTAEDRRAAIQRKKKKRKKRFLAPSAAKSLQLVHLETENEPHEKFHAIKNIFSEVKCAGLLNSCSVVSDDLKIPFAEAYPYHQPKKKFVVSENNDRTVINTAMRMLLPLINSKVDLNPDNDGGVPIAPSLDSFSFLKKKWLHDKSFSDLPLGETLDMSEDEDEANNSSPDTGEIMPADNSELSRFLAGDCSIGVDKRVLVDPELCSLFNFDNSLIMEDEAGCEDINNDSLPSSPSSEVFLLPKTPPSRSSFVFPKLVEPGSTLKSFENSYMHPPLPHPQGTFETVINPLFKVGIDPVVDAALTGRCQGKTKKVVQHISKRKAGPIRRKARSRFVTFEKDSEVLQKKVSQGKRNKHTENYMNKWLPSDTLLNPVSFVSSDFKKTFIIPLSEVPEWETSLSDSDDGNDAEMMSNMELNRSFGYDHNHVATDDGCENRNQPYKAEVLGYLDSAFDDLQLVPKPEMVKREIVHYARHSKNVDQKRVKATIWNVITNHYVKIERSVLSEQDQNVQSEEQSKRVTVVQQHPLKFSEMYGRLIEALPSSIKNQMSIHIAFVSLLHLANEKNLDLKQKANENDFSVLLEPSTNFN